MVERLNTQAVCHGRLRSFHGITSRTFPECWTWRNCLFRQFGWARREIRWLTAALENLTTDALFRFGPYETGSSQQKDTQG